MRLLQRQSLLAGVLCLASAGTAAAADLAKGYYEADGYITASTCTGALAKGKPVDSWVYYPGAGATGFTLATPTTTSSTATGGATTQLYRSTTAIPSGGLGGASLTLGCYSDTTTGSSTTLQSQIKPAAFKVGASHSSAIWQVSMNATVIIGGKTSCTYTSDTTWSLE